MKMRFAVLIVLISIVLVAFNAIEDALFIIPSNFPKPHYDFVKNPLTPEKVELGRVLFYDPQLSVNNTISCASCHSQFNAFTHVDHALSHGIEDKIGTRNSPALMNLAWHKSFMWDGAINHLDMQALAPINHPAEMGETIEHVVVKLQKSKIYPKLFLKAYGDSIITGKHILKSLSQFLLTLVSANSKYDSVIRKQSTFSEQEEKGYALFRQHCANCHNEPLFTNLQFENNGLSIDTLLKDYGRIKVTKNPNDSLKFKVPTLRNVEFTYPYMHDGRFKRLSDVLNHYTDGIHHTKTLSHNLQQPILLSSNQKVDIISFLLTLTDKNFLFTEKHSYPKNILIPSPSTNKN